MYSYRIHLLDNFLDIPTDNNYIMFMKKISIYLSLFILLMAGVHCGDGAGSSTLLEPPLSSVSYQECLAENTALDKTLNTVLVVGLSGDPSDEVIDKFVSDYNLEPFNILYTLNMVEYEVDAGSQSAWLCLFLGDDRVEFVEMGLIVCFGDPAGGVQTLTLTTSFDYPGSSTVQINSAGQFSYDFEAYDEVVEQWSVALTEDEFNTLADLITQADLGSLTDIDDTDAECVGGTRTEIEFTNSGSENNFSVWSCDVDGQSEIPTSLQLLFDEINSLEEKYP